MALFYVNKNPQIGGEHEIHTSSCAWLPKPENRIILGEFIYCSDAIKEARKYYDDVDGCKFCCPACHKK
jgi:hypothetical protein